MTTAEGKLAAGQHERHHRFSCGQTCSELEAPRASMLRPLASPDIPSSERLRDGQRAAQSSTHRSSGLWGEMWMRPTQACFCPPSYRAWSRAEWFWPQRMNKSSCGCRGKRPTDRLERSHAHENPRAHENVHASEIACKFASGQTQVVTQAGRPAVAGGSGYFHTVAVESIRGLQLMLTE